MKKQQQFMIIALVLITLLANVLVVVNAQSDAPAPATPKPFIGVTFNQTDDGVKITGVISNSPAETAGLQEGDIVTALDGEAVTAKNFGDLVQAKAVGDTITLTITRDGESQDLSVTLAEAPAMDTLMPGMHGQMQERPYLGIQLTDKDASVVIAEVVPGSPAETAGLQPDDVITKVNGTDVTTAKEVVEAVQALKIGDTVTLTVTRDGETQDITATLEGMAFTFQFGGRGDNMPDMPNMPDFNFNFDLGDMPGMRGMELGMPLGAEVALLDETVAKEYNLTQTEGLYIVRVPTGSAAETAGLKAGDVVTAVNGTAINTDTDFRALMEGVQPGDKLTLDVLRGGETIQIEVEVGDMMRMPDMHFFQLPPMGGTNNGHGGNGGNGDGNGAKDGSTKSA